LLIRRIVSEHDLIQIKKFTVVGFKKRALQRTNEKLEIASLHLSYYAYRYAIWGSGRSTPDTGNDIAMYKTLHSITMVPITLSYYHILCLTMNSPLAMPSVFADSFLWF
jgi:hypothetical protein